MERTLVAFEGSEPWVVCHQEVTDVSLGQRIKQLRKERNWSQDELAAQADIDGRQISRYENDRVTPSIEVIVKLGKAFDVSLDYLLLEDAPRRSLEQAEGPVVSRLRAMQSLTEEDETSLLHLLDAIEAKNRLKALAAEMR